MDTPFSIKQTLDALGSDSINPGASTGTRWMETGGDVLESVSPVDGMPIACIRQATPTDYEDLVKRAGEGAANTGEARGKSCFGQE